VQGVSSPGPEPHIQMLTLEMPLVLEVVSKMVSEAPPTLRSHTEKDGVEKGVVSEHLVC
jgi:hypothetical protein